MKTANKLPATNDNSWLGITTTEAKFKIINDESKWQLVGSCIDTAKEIQKTTAKLQKKYSYLWLFTVSGKQPLF